MSIELKTIAYIGEAPKRRSPFQILGGWILLLMALGISYFFLEPLVPFLVAQRSEANERNARAAIEALRDSGTFGGQLAAAALEQTALEPDPALAAGKGGNGGGDARPETGWSADLLVQSYRSLGVDLQQLVQEDMEKNIRSYPQYWKWKGPDPAVDHRRVPNLHRYFSRYGMALPVTRNHAEFAVGDVVVWRLPNATSDDGARHIGVVVPGPGAKSHEKWVVHNEGSGPEWDDDLFQFELIGHYRYAPGAQAVTVVEEK
ncbi:MAG: DUF1287 domain-containing protein [Akkermansiaceae bacterium]|nr:DUF1287 domain-containing protein [Akkermansiaceae bacterium]NNM28827.1 DUF1287 domain-containing protein [Akkermansiaceae bacterium]